MGSHLMTRTWITGLATLGLVALNTPVLSAQPAELFRPVTGAAVTVTSSRADADRGVLRARQVAVDVTRLAAESRTGDAGGTLTLNLFDDVVYTATRDAFDTTARGFVWSGHLLDVAPAAIVFAVEDGITYGAVLTPTSTYLVRPTG